MRMQDSDTLEEENYILDKLKVENGKLKANPYDDKQVYILRPCMIHGSGNKGNLNLLYNVVRKGVPWPLGAFENRRSFTSIDNLCYVVEGLLTKEVASGIYHMGDDEALSTNELITLMCRALERKPHIWKINRGLMEFCARLCSELAMTMSMPWSMARRAAVSLVYMPPVPQSETFPK